jgi:hypothetical protein
MRGYKKIENQRLRDAFCSFLFEVVKIGEEEDKET